MRCIGLYCIYISTMLHVNTVRLTHDINTMRAAHVLMAKETTAEQAANATNLIAIKNFFKDLFGHCSFSLSRNHPVVM